MCTGTAGEQHHRKRRRDGGHGLANIVDACPACHRHAHAHPQQARERGWIVSAFEVDPSAVPIVHDDPEAFMWLHEDGTRTAEGR